MIPILYDKNEIAFTSNGLGRLYDTISCVVTEERNGIYECDFEYPVTGKNFDKIMLGRIIGVEHDDSSDVQPFDIVSYSKPINGVVTFHAEHISYRLTKSVVSGNNINSLTAALVLLSQAEPKDIFTFSTNKPGATGRMGAADGVPRSVRQMLGGVEGSILDAYGGEYLFDKFSVQLLAARGVTRPFTIRYGVNMVDYNEEMSCAETFTSCVPYWIGQDETGNDVVVTGSRVDSGETSCSGRNDCVPMDFTDKFEAMPTAARLEQAAATWMASKQSYLPSRTITVDFVRLQDTSEYDQYASLMECNLCDSVRVVFPNYGVEGCFKIVKTEYNVLSERYNAIELGTLSTTLSQALGIEGGSSPTNNVMSGLKIKTLINGETFNTPQANAWCDTGLRFTVPEGKVYLCDIYQNFANGHPKGIGVKVSNVTINIPPYCNFDDTSKSWSQSLTVFLSAGTYSVMTYRGNLGENRYYVRAIEFEA